MSDMIMHDSDLLDNHFFNITDGNDDMLVPWFLLATYAYYVDGEPILSDNTYDRMCRKLCERWSDIDHRHKHYIDPKYLVDGQYGSVAFPADIDIHLEVLRQDLLTSG